MSTSVNDRTTYAFSNSSNQATDQLASLEHFLDPVTTGVLEDLDIQPGDRCLEIGPGRGSIARYLAGRVGPTGQVVAVDLDPSRLEPADNLEVHQRDIRDGLPVAGPFRVIHARLVLVHLPERRDVVRMLIDALAPGGWLILGEFGDHDMTVYSSDSDADRALYTRVVRAIQRVLEDHGVDIGWADDVYATMREAGLRDVQIVEHAECWPGGSTGSRLHHSNTVQKQDELLAAGLTLDELTRFRELMDDPGFAARSYRFVCTHGRRPPN